ncbi:MAG: hypothetical protein IJ572_05885 [Bacilli bacterium]|nr:hypothetical protein [Bacilli bacterium]
MYYDDNVKIKIDWKNLIIKLILVVLFVLLIIWLFPVPKLDTFYNKIYNENLSNMKEVSEKYFASENLPETTGSSVTIKLQDMLDKKIITNFTDKNNKECSNTNSYAQVTKTDNNNYVLKVQLSCDDKTDYILENLDTVKTVYVNKNSGNANVNSNSNNDSNAENKNESSNETIQGQDDGIEIDPSILNSGDSKYDKDLSVTEYEYKKPIVKQTTTYVCPEGYIRDNNSCYKYETGETIDATPLYFNDVTQKTDAKKNVTGAYTKKGKVIKTVEKEEKICPEGYTLNGNICYKYVNATVVPGTTTYVCPEGYTKNGTSCTKTLTATEKVGDTSYYCPEGYSLYGTKCYKYVDANKNINQGSYYYTCDKGVGSLNGTKCTYSASRQNGSTTCKCTEGYEENGRCVVNSSYTGTYHAGQINYQSCPSGYSESGSKCTKTNSYAATKNVSWSNPTVSTSSTALSEYNNGTTKRVLANKSCTLRGCTYTYHTYTANVSYSCPNGGTLSNQSCISYSTIDRSYTTTDAYYTCNDGSRQSSSTCYTKTYKDKTCNTTSGSYYCPYGGSVNQSNGTCTYDATYHKNDDNVSYTCPDGYHVVAGNSQRCEQIIDATIKTGETTYSCPAGYTVNGKNCTNTIAATPVTTDTKYTCPSGYVQEGTTCYQYTEPTNKKTYKYNCSEGYTKNGEGEKTTCTKKVESTTTYYCEDEDEELVGDKCVKVVKGGIKGYTCPEGYILNKNKCVKKTLECAPLQEVTNTSTTYEYTWSSDPYLQGWTQTGKTRTSNTTQVTNINAYEK